jgi:hypothetical protein
VSTLITGVTSRCHRLPMPRPWGPDVTCQYCLQAQTGPGHGLVFATATPEEATR